MSLESAPRFPLNPSTYLDAIDEETSRQSLIASRFLGAPVPTCPEWEVADLLEHVGRVQRRIAVRVTGTELAQVVISPPSERADWVAEGGPTLVAALEGAGVDSPCATLDSAQGKSGFWYRRAAHEVTVHRVDAEIAAGEPRTSIDPTFAADGIDELFGVHLGRWLGANPVPGLEGCVAFEPTDTDVAWTVLVQPDRASVSADSTPRTTVRGRLHRSCCSSGTARPSPTFG